MLAGVVMLAAGWPAVLAALLVVPYVVSHRAVPVAAGRPVRAGARGLAPVPVAQLVTGFLVTQLLIWVALR